jgi:hypothetical protein
VGQTIVLGRLPARQATKNDGLPHGTDRERIAVGQTIVLGRLPAGRPQKTMACPTALTGDEFLSSASRQATKNDGLPHASATYKPLIWN